MASSDVGGPSLGRALEESNQVRCKSMIQQVLLVKQLKTQLRNVVFDTPDIKTNLKTRIQLQKLVKSFRR